MVAVDYSEAIFVARRNLRDSGAVFVMADVLDLPFAPDAFDFAYCLGVLHHLPVDALEALERLLRPVGARHWLPLAETYAGKPWRTLRTDAYDRFFTSIEQRVPRARIEALREPGTAVTISDQPPYWHFLLTRTEARSGAGA